MITSTKEIYEKTAENNNLDIDLVESVGNSIFKQLKEKLTDPDSICYELPKMGTFRIKFPKFEQYYKIITSLKRKKEYPEELIAKRTEMLNQIAEYREAKKEAKEKRKNNEQNKS